MTCEICDEQTATMWVERPSDWVRYQGRVILPQSIPSCADCGPQLGYKVLASLTSVQCRG